MAAGTVPRVEILHITRRSDWDAARAAGSYRWSTRGRTYEDVGFIHASSRAQLPAVAAFVFAGDRDELCVLRLETGTITAAVLEPDLGAGAPRAGRRVRLGSPLLTL